MAARDEGSMSAAGLACGCTMYGGVWSYCATHRAEVETTVVLAPRDDGPKGYYGPPVELLLMDDGTVRWRYDA